ncbi:T-complex-associated testis-expressed protein 1 [Hondaea fermentalgiana]|uniref:T-complex-associated testis-expressed protein 1 n=1 Tax=Hondaea fermentalgiana TaxID=2315210 RepID=A0A2R5GES2_9STRA|nr:T-complex-associated testis-expressed protein 1 [Hondaea fermentalgiana]|eukprot:GBG29436.1 T-complex-associated testis-expressed protein 1 [Hondaea fermentalgiana]
MMEAGIGSTTTAIAVADEVKRFKSRVLEARPGKNPARHQHRGSLDEEGPVLSLRMWCLKTIAKNFERSPMMTRVPDSQVPKLTALLDLNLNIEVAAAHIYDENYWKRRSMAKAWKHLEIANHGMTWKQLYLERTLQDLLEEYSPEGGSDAITEETILEHLRASQDFVFQLRIGQLLSHFDPMLLFEHLPNLSRLELTYGVRRVGMQYERSLFGMRMSDAGSLARAIKASSTLTTICLPCNLVDDDMVQMLMTGLISNCTVTHLDLSHNKITNHGVRLLVKLLGPKSVVSTLNLCDNQIHVEGGRYLGRALRHNASLLDLNLRLNRLTDEGGRLLLDGAMRNSSLMMLNLSSNSLASKSANSLCALFDTGIASLTALDLSCNEFSEEDGEALVKSLGKFPSLVSLDARRNLLGSALDTLSNIVKRNELAARGAEGKY